MKNKTQKATPNSRTSKIGAPKSSHKATNKHRPKSRVNVITSTRLPMVEQKKPTPGSLELNFFPLFGAHIRCVIQNHETWFVRQDALVAFKLEDGPRWKYFLQPRMETNLDMQSRGASTEYLRVVSELGLYHIMAEARDHYWCYRFTQMGGDNAVGMIAASEKFDNDTRNRCRLVLSLVRREYMLEQKNRMEEFGSDPFDSNLRGDDLLAEEEMMDEAPPF